jgi:anti-sigma factor RsiW
MTMRDCPDGTMRDLLPLFASGTLNAEDRDRVESHLESCADCAAEVALLQAVNRAYPARPVNVAAIAARIPAKRRTTVSRRSFYREPLWRAAASVTLFIAGTATVLVVRGGGLGTPGTSSAQVAVQPNGMPATAAETTIASAAGGVTRSASDAILSLGTELSDLTDAQLETLLGSLDGLDSRPQADPTTIATPIIQERTQAPGRNNQ